MELLAGADTRSRKALPEFGPSLRCLFDGQRGGIVHVHDFLAQRAVAVGEGELARRLGARQAYECKTHRLRLVGRREPVSICGISACKPPELVSCRPYGPRN